MLCVYASVDAFDRWTSSHVSNLSNIILNYEDNIREGNLQIVNFRSHYESALKGGILPFNELKSRLEKTLLERRAAGKVDKIIVFADGACELTRNRKFTKCEALEKWWSDTHKEWMEKNLDITVVCPHPSIVLKDKSLREKKSNIAAFHTICLDLDEGDFLLPRTKRDSPRSIRVLVVESELDLQTLYREYLGSVGVDIAVADNGKSCLELIKKQNHFDMIILDTHLSDISGIEVAKKILEVIPSMRIVITTTSGINKIRSDVAPLGVSIEEILLKPFHFSRLLSVIRPRNSQLTN